MHSDPIADYLAQLKNAITARHQVVEMPTSKMKVAITKILHEQGYILNYKVTKKNNQDKLLIALKYDRQTMDSPITNLKRVSRPGLRRYENAESIPRVMNGLGLAIVSTSHGVMTDKQARKDNLGGEIICYVY